MQPCTYPYPTVLVARDDDGLGDSLIKYLRRTGFHVLEANGWPEVFNAVKVHSRPIHVLLADARMADQLPILRNHRSELHVVLVKKPVDAEVVLANVGKLLGSPPFSIG